jgi:ABC-2 type transport system permease protein
MIRVIALKELKSLFLSPLAWSLLGVLQLILAWIFLVQVDQFIQLQPRLAAMQGAPGLTDLVAAPILGSAATFIMLFMPLLSMRLLSDEYRNGTISLLLSAPVSMTQIVLGKYLGLLGFLVIALLLCLLMPLSLSLGGSLDWGKLAAASLGLLLMSAALAAIGLWISSLTSQPAVAAVASYGVLLFLWIISMAAESNAESGHFFQWLSLQSHYLAMLKGLVKTADLAYYALVICAFLLLAIRQLHSRRTEA